MDNTSRAIAKIKETNWAKENPQSSKEIADFLMKIKQNFDSIPGYPKVLKDIITNQPLQWFNYFSQIRCANFLREKGLCIKAFDKKKNGKVVDLEFSNGLLCEIKSFETKLDKDPTAIEYEEHVFDNFLKQKLVPAFENQEADLVIIDNIFMYESKNYRFLEYFMSFDEDPDTERYEILNNKLGKYKSKILLLCFSGSMTNNPILKFIGGEWKIIFNTITY